MTGTRSRRTAFVVTAIALATTAALALAELALRALDIPATPREFRFLEANNEVSELFGSNAGIFEYDEDLLWRLDPDTELYVANELGMRGWLPQGDKGPRDVRLAFVGDSCTFGYAVHYEDTYGVRIEHRLQGARPNRRIESILAAMVGHSSQQNLVLFRDSIAAFAPDVTVLYIGAWNDHLASVGMTDSQRYEQRHALRLTRMWNRVFGDDRTGDASTPEAMAKLKAGEAPFGLRVSRTEFRANLDAIVEHARGAGSGVVCIIPPVPDTTIEQRPVAAEYLEIVRAFASHHELPTLDGNAVFAAHRERHPETAPLFSDWIHPTKHGHEVLATALYPIVEQLVEPKSMRAPQSIELAHPPAAVTALSGTSIELVGRGFAEPVPLDRIWIGDRWAAQLDRIGDEHVRVRLPLIPAGAHEIRFITSAGLTRAPFALEVTEPPTHHPLTATPAEIDGKRCIDLASSGPFGAWFAAWWSTKRRDEPIDTQYGPFELDDGTPPDAHREGEVYRFDLLKIERVLSQIGRSGAWRHRIVLPDLSSAGRTVFVQGAILDPTSPLARITEVVEVTF